MRMAIFFFLTLGLALSAEDSIKAPVPNASLVILEPKLASFRTGEADEWTTRRGANAEINLQLGLRLPGLSGEALRLTGKKIDPSKSGGEFNWFVLDKKVSLEKAIPNADGIRLVLATGESSPRYLRLILTTRRGTFAAVLEPQRFGPAFEDRLFDFKKLTKNDPDFQIQDITKISIEGTVSENSLYLAELSFYQTPQWTGGYSLRTAATNGVNLYEPRQEITLVFSEQGILPADKKAFRYEIKNYWGATAKTGDVPLEKGQSKYEIRIPALPPGFYETRAYWLNEKGVADSRSMLLATGSMPVGLSTFAVMPTSLADAQERMRLAGTNAFLGLHGTSPGAHGGMQEYIGAPWYISGSRWTAYEGSTRPERNNGETATWVEEKFSKASLQPLTFGIVNFMPNHDIPKWASSGEKTFPGWKSWDDFLLFVRDRVRLNKKIQAHMSPRLYDATWEVDLSFIPGFSPILWNASNVVEVYRRVRGVVKQEDPEALMIGPCRSSVNGSLDWYRELARAGLFEQIDIFSIHPYHSPPPENDRVDEKIRDLIAALPEIAGKKMPIISTEQGYAAIFGSTHKYREQSEWLLRTALILLGEGVRVHHPFYAYDYQSEAGFGIFFNNEPKQPWGPKDISPKPTVPALAVFSRELLDAKPIRSLRFLDESVWGYIYEKGGKPVIALWTSAENKKLSLVTGQVSSVELSDMMGVNETLSPQNGSVSLNLGPDPIYLKGVDPDIYGRSVLATVTAPFPIFPGESKNFAPPLSGGESLLSVKSFGVLKLTISGNKKSVQVAAPVDAAVGNEPLILTIRTPAGERKETHWMQIPVNLQIEKVSRTEGNLFEIAIKNFGVQKTSFELSAKNNPDVIRGEITGGGGKTVILPFGRSGDSIDTARAMETEFLFKSQGREKTIRQKVYFLKAYESKTPDDTWNQARFSGPGSSGQTDKATTIFRFDKNELEIQIDVEDDAHFQPQTEGSFWKSDSIQIAFDPEPDKEAAYNPILGSFGKRNSEFDLALTPSGPRIFRTVSFDSSQLPSGLLTHLYEKIRITRDEPSKTTRYQIRLPAKELGMDAFTSGKEIGVAILINDQDGDKMPRKFYGLFDGIASAKEPKLFGRLSFR